MSIENTFDNPFEKKSELPNLPAIEDIPKKPGDPDYSPFLDPDSVWYGIHDFRPRSDRPIPTMRCYKIKKDGNRCLNRGIRGSGYNGTNAVCHIHGGQLPSVKEYAKSVTEAARLQIFAGAPDAVQTIMNIMTNPGTQDQIKLKAATELLDRAGVRGGVEIDVEVVDHRELPSEKLKKKLASLRPKEEEIIDAETLEDLGEGESPEEDPKPA